MLRRITSYEYIMPSFESYFCHKCKSCFEQMLLWAGRLNAEWEMNTSRFEERLATELSFDYSLVVIQLHPLSLPENCDCLNRIVADSIMIYLRKPRRHQFWGAQSFKLWTPGEWIFRSTHWVDISTETELFQLTNWIRKNKKVEWETANTDRSFPFGNCENYFLNRETIK